MHPGKSRAIRGLPGTSSTSEVAIKTFGLESLEVAHEEMRSEAESLPEDEATEGE